MPLAPGTRLGPYEILALIGAGGMGEVYRAKDTNLGRDVAIKVLPDALAHDTERMARFEREAHVLASLNHPHIATVYGFEAGAIGMELVEGPTLSERIGHRAMPLDEALPIARQIAEGLEYAHERGVVHRDLKPANVKLTADGNVKILDFGLAKALETPAPQGNPSTSPTLTLEGTRAGVILGTAAYMAPEQARGAIVDKRADIWAFGVVLHEMLTGQQPFAGATVSDTLAAVLKTEPDWKTVPTPARGLVRRCLAKDPRLRLRDIGDARLALAEIGSAPDAPPRSAPKATLWKVAAGLLGLALLILAFFRPTPTGSPTVLSVLPPGKTTFSGFTISRDGRRLAFTASEAGKTALWVQLMDSGIARLLPSTEGASFPFWSPDGRFIGFFAGGKLKKIEISGGQAQPLADALSGRGGAWSREGTIVFAPYTTGNLYSVPSSGGESRPVTKLDTSRRENSHRFPWFLPDNRHFLYYVRSANREDTGVYAAALDSNEVKRVVTADSAGVFTPRGYLLFTREPMLMAQRFQPNGLEAIGEPQVVAEEVWQHGFPGWPVFAASDNNVLAYGHPDTVKYQLTWFNREGKPLETIGPPKEGAGISLAPDGKQLASYSLDARAADIWLTDLIRGTTSRFTSDPAVDWFPVWAPDGKRMAFASDRQGQMDLYQKTIGSDREEVLLSSSISKLPTGWSPNGRFIIYQAFSPQTKSDLWILPMDGDRKPFPFKQTEFEEYDGTFSPDGRWIGYMSDQTGRMEVYVQEFGNRNSPTPGRTWQVSTSGGSSLRWRREGGELFYVGPDGELISVPLKSSPDLSIGLPRKLFDAGLRGISGSTNGNQRYAVASDGKRFLLGAAVGERRPSALTIVLNWTEGLKK